MSDCKGRHYSDRRLERGSTVVAGSSDENPWARFDQANWLGYWLIGEDIGRSSGSVNKLNSLRRIREGEFVYD